MCVCDWGLCVWGGVPGGAPNTFCEPLYMQSTPQSSAKKGTPPREHTVSISSRVLCLWQSSPSPARFWWAPVLLSPCDDQDVEGTTGYGTTPGSRSRGPCGRTTQLSLSCSSPRSSTLYEFSSAAVTLRSKALRICHNMGPCEALKV